RRPRPGPVAAVRRRYARPAGRAARAGPAQRAPARARRGRSRRPADRPLRARCRDAETVAPPERPGSRHPPGVLPIRRAVPDAAGRPGPPRLLRGGAGAPVVRSRRAAARAYAAEAEGRPPGAAARDAHADQPDLLLVR